MRLTWNECSVVFILAVPLNMECAMTACLRSIERTTGKWGSYNAEHNCHILVGAFWVMWDTL
jgi:hypothetical protein